MLEVDTIITLDDDKNYALLIKSELNNNKYFLAAELDEMEEATENYVVLKEVMIDGNTHVEVENDPFILPQLLVDFKKQSEFVE